MKATPRPDVWVPSSRFARIQSHPDGSKRAAWAALVMFIDLNHGTWDPDPPDIDQAEEAMLALAADDVDETWTAARLRERVRFVDQG